MIPMRLLRLLLQGYSSEQVSLQAANEEHQEEEKKVQCSKTMKLCDFYFYPHSSQIFSKFQGNIYKRMQEAKLYGTSNDLLSYKLSKIQGYQNQQRVIKQHNRFYQTQNTYISQYLIPNKLEKKFHVSQSSLYGGKFTSTGNQYYATSQHSKKLQEDINIFDTTYPEEPQISKSINARGVSWAISDTDIDPNQELLIYSTLNPIVNIMELKTDGERHQSLNLQPQANLADDDDDNLVGSWYNTLRIFSCKFSGDGNQIVAGCGAGKVVVYHIPTRQILTKIQGHSNDVNSVCFADRKSSNIIFTGSDDTLIKAWDRRLIGSHMNQNKPVGQFLGHNQGITNISSRGDGIYCASNGKDQKLKLWDIRQLAQPNFKYRPHRQPGFDYRGSIYHSYFDKHPDDNSIATFKGHQVLRTLIRCGFSPMHTTNSRYLYSGSSNGLICIYDILTERLVMQFQIRPSNLSHHYHYYMSANVLRDVSWHPYKPYIYATNFDGFVYITKFVSSNQQENKKVVQVAVSSSQFQDQDYEQDKDQKEEMESLEFFTDDQDNGGESLNEDTETQTSKDNLTEKKDQ